MSGARTVPPSPRRRAEARRAGQVGVSGALVGWAGVLGAALALPWVGAKGFQDLLGFARGAFAGHPADATLDGALRAGLGMFVPVALAAALAAITAGLAQTGALFTLAPLLPGPPRRRARPGLLPALGFGAIALAACALSLRAEAPIVRQLLDGSGGIALAAGALGRVLTRVALALAAAGIGDALLARAAFERSLRMTRAEADAERREDEGDPRLSAERKRRQQAEAGRNLAAEVAGARLVVIGDGVAAALREENGALALGARGERLWAARIVELARRFAVPVRVDDQLAPRLALLAPGQAVPPSLEGRARALTRR